MKFLEVAARLIGQVGYEAVTMTAIAEQSQASIGTLYDYFPDKQTLALALLAQYTGEADVHWKTLLARRSTLTKSALADLFIEGALSLIQKRPAYLPLLAAPLVYSRSAAARQPLRRAIADALQTVSPGLSAADSLLKSQVIVELIKGFFSVYRQTSPAHKSAIAEEFKLVLKLYFSETLR